MLQVVKKWRNKLRLQLSYVRRRVVKPVLPKNSDGKVLAHVGCGTRNSPEFISGDARTLAHVHIATGAVLLLGGFTIGAGDAAYMCRIPECAEGYDFIKVLSEVCR